MQLPLQENQSFNLGVFYIWFVVSLGNFVACCQYFSWDILIWLFGEFGILVIFGPLVNFSCCQPLARCWLSMRKQLFSSKHFGPRLVFKDICIMLLTNVSRNENVWNRDFPIWEEVRGPGISEAGLCFVWNVRSQAYHGAENPTSTADIHLV